MKWILLAILLLTLASSAEDKCSVREFYGIAYTVHNPTERHKQMSSWLDKHKGLCSSGDMVVIWNNLSEWAGTADSVELRQKVIHEYKDALRKETK